VKSPWLTSRYGQPGADDVGLPNQSDGKLVIAATQPKSPTANNALVRC
jgi:hypothetical protein